jgi:uncharacterized protein with von Willebrand factor type A (vWA) domain
MVGRRPLDLRSANSRTKVWHGHGVTIIGSHHRIHEQETQLFSAAIKDLGDIIEYISATKGLRSTRSPKTASYEKTGVSRHWRFSVARNIAKLRTAVICWILPKAVA